MLHVAIKRASGMYAMDGTSLYCKLGVERDAPRNSKECLTRKYKLKTDSSKVTRGIVTWEKEFDLAVAPHKKVLVIKVRKIGFSMMGLRRKIEVRLSPSRTRAPGAALFAKSSPRRGVCSHNRFPSSSPTPSCYHARSPIPCNLPHNPIHTLLLLQYCKVGVVIISDIRLTSALSDTEVQYPIQPVSGDNDNLGFLTVRITALGRSVNTNSGHSSTGHSSGHSCGHSCGLSCVWTHVWTHSFRATSCVLVCGALMVVVVVAVVAAVG